MKQALKCHYSTVLFDLPRVVCAHVIHMVGTFCMILRLKYQNWCFCQNQRCNKSKYFKGKHFLFISTSNFYKFKRNLLSDSRWVLLSFQTPRIVVCRRLFPPEGWWHSRTPLWASLGLVLKVAHCLLMSSPWHRLRNVYLLCSHVQLMCRYQTQL